MSAQRAFLQLHFCDFSILCHLNIHLKHANKIQTLRFLCIFLNSRLRLINLLFVFLKYLLCLIAPLLFCLLHGFKCVNSTAHFQIYPLRVNHLRIKMDKKEHYVLISLVMVAHILFRSLIHFPFVVPLCEKKTSACLRCGGDNKKCCSA